MEAMGGRSARATPGSKEEAGGRECWGTGGDVEANTGGGDGG